SLDDLPWFTFDPAIVHLFAAQVGPEALPAADALVFTTGLIQISGTRFVETFESPYSHVGLPVFFLQGVGVFSREAEDRAIALPGPKVCVGSWLAEMLVQRGVPAADVAHIPNGLDPHTFTVRQLIDDRPAQVAMNFDPHPIKGC